MATDLSSFMKGNALEDAGVKFVVSKRFVGAKGAPIEWELKAIDSDLDERIRKDCTKKVPVVGKRGAYTQETDTDKYLGKLCAACVVYPNLNDKELQTSYGVMDAEGVLKAMLKAGEYAELKAKIAEVNGYDTSMDELVDDAKN